jgi:hypothetical protein
MGAMGRADAHLDYLRDLRVSPYGVPRKRGDLQDTCKGLLLARNVGRHLEVC